MKFGGNAQVIYDKKNKTLYICDVNHSSSHTTKLEGKYGIEVSCDIEGNVTSIRIPEVDTLFGIDEGLFESFN